MENTGNITEYIEQASLAVNMLSLSDMSGLESLQVILDRINLSIDGINGAPAQLIAQAKGTACSAVETLQKILEQKIEEQAHSIEIVSQAVSTIQSLISQITQSAVPANPATATDVPGDAKTQTQQAAAVLEEDASLLLDFVAEAKEHIESAEAGLLALENKPDDKEVLNQIFRAFHTIKGMAGFLNLSDIGKLAHSAENLLDYARKGELVLAGANSDVIFESIDVLKKMMAELKEAMESGKQAPQEQILPQLLSKLKTFADNRGNKDFLKTEYGLKKDEELDIILSVKPVQEAQDAPVTAKTPSTAAGDEKIKVSTTRLDNLINMVGELVIAESMVAEGVSRTLIVEQDLGHKISHLSKIVRELQELSMSMRMVPIQGVFTKMVRLVRDLSRETNKNVELVTFGEETELDRNIVDKISDPLVHMIRNSVDHGIESPDERAKAGKNLIGRIELRAFHQAGNIVIEIRDDGKGLNKERIVEKAIANGIIEAGQKLTEEEIFKLIFHAGLSTAEKVTSVSGRGVGMDVVKKNVDLLHGKIDIASTPGKGTTFTIRLPLTLAIIDGQIVKIGSERYIIPINSIVCSFRMTREQLSSIQTRGEMVIVRNELLPLIRLYKLFKVVPATEDPTKALLVIVEDDNRKCCLLVDELLGQQQVVIKSLGGGLGTVKGTSGGAIMGDGRISLILDISGLMELAQR
jgi:two-component system, chemotaxis family, sensor kinase CheA